MPTVEASIQSTLGALVSGRCYPLVNTSATITAPYITFHEGRFRELANRESFARGNDIIIGVVLLEHGVHGFDIIPGKAPIPYAVDAAHAER